MKQTSKALILSTVLALFAFIPFSYAEDDDFISVSPVEKQDASKAIQQDTVVKQEKPAATPDAQATQAPAVKKEEIQPAGKNRVQNILPLELKDRVEIRITTSSPVKRPKAALLAPPPNSRILIQISNCAVESDTKPVEKGDVGTIRTAQHSSTAWVVIDLKKNSKWSILQDGSTIVVTIPKQGVKIAAAEAPVAGKKIQAQPGPAPGSMIYRVIDVNAKNMDSKTRIIVTTDGPVKYRVKKDSSEKKISMDLIDSVSMWEKGSLKMEDGPVSSVSVSEDRRAKITGVVLSLAYNTPYTVSRDQNQIVIDVDNQRQSMKKPKKKLDLNQKISVNIQSAELPGVLRLLSSQTGFEFSAGPAVATAPNVTIKEENQTLEQVLKDILIPRGLYYEINNDVIKVGDVAGLKASKALMKKVTKFYSPKNMSDIKQLQAMFASAITKDQLIDVISQVDQSAGANRIMVVGTRDDVEKAMNMLADIDVADASSDEGGNTIKTRVFKLENIRLNAVSTDMSDSTKSTFENNQLDDIKSAITPMLSPNGVGTMAINRRISSIIVTDTKSALRKVEKVIKLMDVKLPQVSIDARLYEISVTAERDLGINWNLTGQTKEPSTKGFTASNPLDLTNGAGSLTVGSLQNGLNINAILSAMENSSKATLLSAPKITVESNMPATISTARTYYYEVRSNVINNGSVVSSSSFSSVLLPIELKVYCKVTKAGYINMMVVARVDKVDPTTRTQGPPDTTTQEASTYLNVKNKETIVMGGLIDDQITESEQKVPLLGDLPLIGNLFKGTTKVNDKVELVVFITPSIVEDSE